MTPSHETLAEALERIRPIAERATEGPWRTGPPHTLWRTWETPQGRMHRPLAQFFDLPFGDSSSREANAELAHVAIALVRTLLSGRMNLR